MSTMFDVYQSQADLYDELVSHEDFKNNLYKHFQDTINWRNKSVCEFGVGTGRVTKLYIDNVNKAVVYDKSKHMLEKAKQNLSTWSNKITFLEIDNRNINSIIEQYDIVIEGWSFGHLIVEESVEKDKWIEKIVKATTQIAKEKVIFIETMGTNVDCPTVPGLDLKYFYDKLKRYGFDETVIETNYLFPSYEEAGSIIGGFFGEKMKKEIYEAKIREVNEYTGLWIYTKEKT